MMERSSRAVLNSLLAAAMLMSGLPSKADVGQASISPPPAVGKPVLAIGPEELFLKHPYMQDELFVYGTATSWQSVGALNSDGRWTVTAGPTAPFKTRIFTLRPRDPAKFNGMVLVEWFNVSGGIDGAVELLAARRELLRQGYAYVGVSAQRVGIEGPAAGNAGGYGGIGLKKSNPERYEALSHPGDAFSYDIFSQIGAMAKSSLFLTLPGPKRVIATGQSQSAGYLTTYVNAIDPIARVFDGFLIHSRSGGAASLGNGAKMPDVAQFRPDLRVPVLAVLTENDVLRGNGGYHLARRPDDVRLRQWEVAGTAHADNYMYGGSQVDIGDANRLAKYFVPTSDTPLGKTKIPINPGMANHYTLMAAFSALNSWLRTGKPPASMAMLDVKGGPSPRYAVDANGLTKGGVRSPWVDVPTILINGEADPDTPSARLAGRGIPFSKAKLASLYPGGKADYLRRFTKALDASIKAGRILPADRKEILDIAAINYAG